MKNVQDAIFPLSLVLCLCGLEVFEYPQGRSRLYLTILYILGSWLLHFYTIMRTEMFVMIPIPLFIKVAIAFGTIYMLLAVYHDKTYKSCLEKLNIVNDTLEKLGKPKNYAKLRMQVIWIIAAWIISMLVLNIMDGLRLITNVPTSYAAITMCLPFIVNYSIHIDTLHDVLYLILLRYVGSLFEHVNRYIQELMEQRKKTRLVSAICASSFRHRTNNVKSNQAIYILMHVHFELSTISQKFTSIFELQMLMQTVTFYIFTVQLIAQIYNVVITTSANTYYTYQMIIHISSILGWILHSIIRMLLFNYMCEQICFKANRTEALLNRLANVTIDVEMRENITQFLLQLLRKPLTVSIYGLFDFGYKFIYMVCSFQTNYTQLLVLESSNLQFTSLFNFTQVDILKSFKGIHKFDSHITRVVSLYCCPNEKYKTNNKILTICEEIDIFASRAYLPCNQTNIHHRLFLDAARSFHKRKCSNCSYKDPPFVIWKNCQQFETSTKMMNNIRAVLSPLLFISYVFGLRIVEYPTSKPRTWCSYLYILLIWLTYNLLLVYTLMYYICTSSIMSQLCFLLNIFTAILTVVLGIFHDKKFRSCLRKLAIVDDTLEKLGITTDYQKLYTTILFIVFVWCAFILWIICINTLWLNDRIKSLYIVFMVEYSTFINLLDDLIITSTLGYIGLKFDQINGYLREMENEHKLKSAWEHSALLLRQTGYSKSTGSERVTWIVIHLHLDLRKICHELNSIFGLQMTLKMGNYFVFMILNFRELFNVMLISNYVERTTLYVISITSFLIVNIIRLFIINYICEEVRVKANAMGDVISRVSYTTYDVVIRENISQLILQMNLVPLRFYGLGLFQFGLKFFQGFSSCVTSVIVILIQSHTET